MPKNGRCLRQSSPGFGNLVAVFERPDDAHFVLRETGSTLTDEILLDEHPHGLGIRCQAAFIESRDDRFNLRIRFIAVRDLERSGVRAFPARYEATRIQFPTQERQDRRHCLDVVQRNVRALVRDESNNLSRRSLVDNQRQARLDAEGVGRLIAKMAA